MRLKPCLVTFCLLLLSIVSTYIAPALGSDILRYKRSRHRYFTVDNNGVSPDTESPPSTTPSSTDDEFADSENRHIHKNDDPCLVKYCGVGRECQVSTDGEELVAACVCIHKCARRHRPVCASNGRVYVNHCEMHRAACNADTPLNTRRLSRCLSNGNYSAQARKDFFAYHAFTKGKNIAKYAKSKNKHHPVSKSFLRKNGHDIEKCSAQEYEIMKDNLLLYSHARLMAEDNHSKEYLVSIMFSHYDRNNDGNLEREELLQIAEEENMEELCAGCNFSHMISYDDTDGDGKLNVNEFYMAFSKLYSVSVVSLDKSLEVNHISARVGDNVEIKCDVTGTPPPPLVWRRYGTDVETLSEPEVFHSNEIIRSLSFVVSLVNTVISSIHHTTISINKYFIIPIIISCNFKYYHNEMLYPVATYEERRFLSFHEWGILVYEPSTCHALHEIHSTDIIPGTQEYVCGPKNVPCSWGRAINVADRYVYVSQPDKNRVLVISEVQMMIIDVVATDKNPVDLWYVQNLDYVWVLNWRSEIDVGIKTVQIIKEAAQRKKHHTMRPEPIDAQFDLVKGLYIPQQRDTKHIFKYGYVTHTNQHGMYKLDLVNMRYTRTVNLASYNCVPTSMEFSDLYGFVILQCEEPITGRPTGQVLLDYLTDSVLAHKPSILGKPAISPDSRYLVTLDKQNTGKVEMITGVGKATPPHLTKWGNPNRPIIQSGIFGRYMVSPSNQALFVLNGETRTVNCEIGGLIHPGAIVWFTVSLR
ncbi:FSTL5 protein, partial [Pseudoatta argentina]